MSGQAILTRILCAITVLSFAIMAVCLTFVVPAGAVDHTGWDFDFSVQPADINVGQMVNVSVHTYYFANDSHGKPFQADAPDVLVTITSAFFNTIQPADSQGWLINADHPDVPGNYTYTAKVVFDMETKTKTVTLVVHPAGTATTVPVSGSPSPVVTTPPANDGNISDIEPDQINISNLDQPLLPGNTANGTGAQNDNPYVVMPASASPTATPAPTKSPSETLSILGTVTVLTLVGIFSRKKK
jgi:hypothetical protein